MSTNNYKSFGIIGDCFTAGTLISTTNGFKKNEEIALGDKVLSEFGISEVIQLFETAEKPLYKIELENGLSNICTKDQKIRIFDKNLEFKWKSVDQLEINDYVVCKPINKDIIKVVYANDIEIDESLSYFIGLFLADGWIDRDKKRGYNRICIANNRV